MVQACALNRNSAETRSFIWGKSFHAFQNRTHLHLVHLGGGAGFFCTPCLSCVCSVMQRELAARLRLKMHLFGILIPAEHLQHLQALPAFCLTGTGSTRGVRGRLSFATSSATLTETRHTHKLWRPPKEKSALPPECCSADPAPLAR